jgi:7-carboxy-7-deazaguanine synthase
MKTYAVREIFMTIQGEGARTGEASVFVRFAGCNLWNGNPEDRDKGKGACALWCDTDFAKGEKMTVVEILAQAAKVWTGDGARAGEAWLVITGGEPLLQLDAQFISHAHAQGWKVAVESNGTVGAPPGVDWLTVSPKLGTQLVDQQVQELKVVLPGGPYGGWTDSELEALARKYQQGKTRLYVQPQDVIQQSAVEVTYLKRSLLGAKDEFELNLKRCTDFVMRNPWWKLSYQMHKAAGLR